MPENRESPFSEVDLITGRRLGPPDEPQKRPGVNVSPHPFEPLRRWRNKGRCARCYLSESLHPTKAWVQSRPLGDKRSYPYG